MKKAVNVSVKDNPRKPMHPEALIRSFIKKVKKEKKLDPQQKQKEKIGRTELFAHKKELQSVPGSGYVVNGVKNGHVD
jgi:hypothetical protein